MTDWMEQLETSETEIQETALKPIETITSLSSETELNERKETIKQKLLAPQNLKYFEDVIVECKYTKEKIYRSRHHGKAPSPKPLEEQEAYEKSVLLGAVFEELVKYESIALSESFPIADELQRLLSHPAQYNLSKEIGHVRNPDIAYVEVKGCVKVEGVGDAKAARSIDERVLNQIRDFKSN